MISNRPNVPQTLMICCDESTQCQNEPFQGAEPSRHLTTHLVARILAYATTSIEPMPPLSLGIVQISHRSKGTPLTPPYLAHKYAYRIYLSR